MNVAVDVRAERNAFAGWRFQGASLATALPAICILLAIVLSLTVYDGPPETAALPFADWISLLMKWFVDGFRPLFRAVDAVLTFPLEILQSALVRLPWPIIVLIAAALGFLARGWRLAGFCALSLFYVVATGYWEKTALTLASVAVAIPLSAVAGLFIGIWGSKSRWFRRGLAPALDLMQTIPTFAYLIPILVLFGIGPVVGIVASAIYAMPPMIRNVMLALDRVPPTIVEAALMSGTTPRQLLWWAEIPAAMPGILIGINQTIMAGFSMVVIASLVGGVDDIGLEVVNAMRQAKFGESILAGLVIAFLAMTMDRVSRSFAENGSRELPAERRSLRIMVATAAAAVVLSALGWFVPEFVSYPEKWVLYPAGALNDALNWFTVVAFPVTSAMKTWVVFYLLTPLKTGLPNAVHPMSWGFEMGPFVTAVYVTGVAVVVGYFSLQRAWRAAVAALAVAALYYFGTTGIPWPVTITAVTALAYRVGGGRTALLAATGLGFIVVNGIWIEAMVTVQLCILGVALAFLIGTALGICGALDNRVSAILRPICDTLQTMPIFVFLIPAIMVFLVGDFSALIAMVMYTFVPAARYTEHGIRSVPPEIVEASISMGASRWDRLVRVQLPLAFPEIMLGLNQTIMMALAIVVVAALVGAKGLGQEIMVALNLASTGKGIVAGLAIAFIAMIADRILLAWSAQKRAELGLG